MNDQPKNPTDAEREIFLEALQCETLEKRAAFLDGACAGNPAIRHAVETLLKHHKADDFMQSPGWKTVLLAGSEKPGDRIGRYKLLQQIGEGGCGVVYMAEQTEPVRRRVALKVIKLGMDTKSVIARFEAERQALALMDHPNISKVLDAGATDSGRPYFVMELVRGIKITEYCDKNHVHTRERLGLFVQVCQAVQHAHQKGIIHRDIKPSNILVTLRDGLPVPKVIDFGIAKATTEQRLTDKTLFTAFEQFIGTPAYMSPEQAEMSELGIDTRSDIYSLGVLLYELLTSQTPFDASELRRAGLDEIRRIIREEEPARPSTRLSTMTAADLTEVAKRRQMEPAKLSGLVRGELDWIVMKALEKDRARRYGTAVGLAMDVERYLTDEPVVARPSSNFYRFQKLVRRNKMAFASAAVIFTMLVFGIAVASWQAVRATRAEHEQRALRQQAEAGRAAEAASRQFAEIRERFTKAKAFFDAGDHEQADKLVNEMPAAAWQPNSEAAVLVRDLGSEHAARAEWEQAATTFSNLLRLDALDNQDAVELDFLRYGPVLIELGDSNRYRRFTKTIIAHCAGTTNPVTAERVCKICLLQPTEEETLGELKPFYDLAVKNVNNFGGAEPLRWACVSLALYEYRQGQYAKAMSWSETTLNSYPGGFETYLATAHVIRSMSAYQLHQEMANQPDLSLAREMIDTGIKGFWVDQRNIGGFDWLFARVLLREADVLERTGPTREPETPVSASTPVSLTTPLTAGGFADFLAEGNHTNEAARFCREAVDILPTLKSWETGKLPPLVNHVAEILRDQGKSQEAEVLFERAVAFESRQLSGNSPILGDSFHGFGEFLYQEGKFKEAAEQFILSLAGRRQLQDVGLAWTLRDLGDALVCAGRAKEAEPYLREALGLYHTAHQSEDFWATGWTTEILGRAFDQQANLPKAEQAYREALLAYAKSPGLALTVPREMSTIQSLLAVLTAEKKPSEAAALYQEWLQRRRAQLSNEDPNLADMLAQVASVFLVEEKFVEAEPLARECLVIREKKLPADWRTDNARSLLGGCLLGQKKYAEAEPLLLSGYEGMKQKGEKVFAEGKPHLKEALQRLVQLEQATGHLEQIAQWETEATEWDRKTVEQLRKAAATGSTMAANNLAWFLATCENPDVRDGHDAMSLAEKAVGATNRKDPTFLDTLAAACAEAGQFDQAARVEKEAISLLQSEPSKQDFTTRLRLYESNTPYREKD